MDEWGISVLCSINGCEWRVVGDTRCVEHGGHPCYAWEPSIWGEDEYQIAGDNSPETFTEAPVLEGHHA